MTGTFAEMCATVAFAFIETYIVFKTKTYAWRSRRAGRVPSDSARPTRTRCAGIAMQKAVCESNGLDRPDRRSSRSGRRPVVDDELEARRPCSVIISGRYSAWMRAGSVAGVRKAMRRSARRRARA